MACFASCSSFGQVYIEQRFPPKIALWPYSVHRATLSSRICIVVHQVKHCPSFLPYSFWSSLLLVGPILNIANLCANVEVYSGTHAHTHHRWQFMVDSPFVHPVSAGRIRSGQTSQTHSWEAWMFACHGPKAPPIIRWKIIQYSIIMFYWTRLQTAARFVHFHEQVARLSFPGYP